jgi:nitroimidazol reductase NimA-like FMN-containing flavoprotein (pyridoxamine 5'-phosphate oxidase superfamily)
MRFDGFGIEVLDRDECIRLLASVPLGRVVFTDRALPAIQPVNFTLDGPDVILRIATGSKLAAAVRSTVVAFEADAFDPELHTGWSVTLVGHARLVNSPQEIDRLSQLPLQQWTPGPSDRFVRIRGHVSGRRIQPATV